MTQAQVLPSKPGAPRRGWPEHWQALLLVVILGTKRALGMAIRNDRPIRRYTNLAQTLRSALTPVR